MRRGLLCAPARERERDLQNRKRNESTIERHLGRVGLSLEKLSRLKSRLMQMRAKIRRFRTRVKQRTFHRKNARWETWRKAGGDLPER